jgi:hypothetical protein
MEQENIPPDGIPAVFVPSQKGTSLLQDDMNFCYRIHQKNSEGTMAYYRCVKRQLLKCPAVATLNLTTSRIMKVTHSHTHTPNLLLEAARAEEKKLIKAAATVGNSRRSEVVNRVKMNILQSSLPEAQSALRKTHAVGQAIQREKKRMLGISGTVPKTPAEIMENLPERFKKTSGGGPFLRHMEKVGEDSMILVFMSDYGKWVLSKSEHVFCDGTFDTAPPPFKQIYFLLGKMPEMSAVPCVFALLPNKETSTYKKLLEVVSSLVPFQPGLPSRVFMDFEKAVMNSVAAAFPWAKLCGCHFHQKQVKISNIW